MTLSISSIIQLVAARKHWIIFSFGKMGPPGFSIRVNQRLCILIIWVKDLQIVVNALVVVCFIIASPYLDLVLMLFVF